MRTSVNNASSLKGEKNGAPVSSPHTQGPLLSGKRLIIAQLIWGTLVVLTLTLSIAAIPARVKHLLNLVPGYWVNPTRVQFIGDFYAWYFVLVELVAIFASITIAAVIFWHKANDRMALLTSIMLTTYGAAIVVSIGEAENIQPLWWQSSFLVVRMVAAGLVPIFFYTFPNGYFVPSWTRPLAVIWIALTAAWIIFPPLDPFKWPNLLWASWFPLWGSTCLLAQAYRYVHISNSVERQQAKWLITGSLGGIIGFALFQSLPTILPLLQEPTLLRLVYDIAGTPAYLGSMLFMPLSIATSILRYRLWDIDIIINRTLVYGLLTVVTVGMYVLIVGVLGAIFQTQGNLLVSLLAAGFIAVFFQALREQLQTGINRLMFGERDDPYAVLSRLGQQLEATVETAAVLSTIVKTVSQALKSPYAAIILKQGEEFKVVAAYPTSFWSGADEQDEAIDFALVHQARVVGHLRVAPRAPGESFSVHWEYKGYTHMWG